MMQNNKYRHYTSFMRGILFGISTALLPLSSFAGSELYPGMFSSAAPGTQSISAYFYKRKMEGYYVDGTRQGGAKLKASASVLAFTSFGQTAGMASSWTITLPDIRAQKTAGHLPLGFGDSTNTLSDVRLGYTFWPFNDIESGRSFAIASTLQIPTAKYDNTQSLNAGDNRWRATVQFGWVQKITPTFTVEFIPEVSVYKANSNYVGYKMTQKPSYAATTFLRWRFLPTWESFAGFQSNGGGNQTIAGIAQNNQPRQQRLFLGLSTGLAENLYTSLRYSHDNAVNYELKTRSDLVLSLHYLF